MFRVSRERSGEDRFFAVKAAMLVIGAAVGIAGMVYQIGWLVWAAIVIVGTGIILRLIAARRRE
jgi:hypothetical protein